MGRPNKVASFSIACLRVSRTHRVFSVGVDVRVRPVIIEFSKAAFSK